MPEPLICTNNTLGNIDYGIPIVANKSSDYRTTTGSYHRHVPNVAQEFVCRAKAKIKPELKIIDAAVRDENIKSTYTRGCVQTQPPPSEPHDQPSRVTKVHYVRQVQERVFKTPPPPKLSCLSEMKELYCGKPIDFYRREIFPPEPHAKCKIQGLGRDEQPAVRPEEKGFWKWTDPYLSTTRGVHVPFTKDQQNGVARKDIVTFYDIADLPKVKGFGPKHGPATEPLLSKKNIPMTDKMPFKLHPTDRHVRRCMKIVPNFGRTSECKANYVRQSFSDMYPYLFQNGVEISESLSKASPWQDLAPPGMYCTEYCHIGTGWPINCIIDYGLPKEYLPHKPCYTKFYDWSQ